MDRDPSVSVPIEDIEKGIEVSEVCLAEISTDNPNVWFELGYAIARKRDVALLCSDERKTPFPFDVHHRAIIQYSTESQSDFEKARSKITTRLKALLNKRRELGQVASIPSVSKVEGLEQYEIAGLVAVAEAVEDPEAGISTFIFRQNMEQAGFTQLAATLAVRSLIDREMLERFEDQDYRNGPFTAFKITPEGMRWLIVNKENLNLYVSDDSPQRIRITDDDILF